MSGKRHRINTLNQQVAVYRSLSAERKAVFLRELGEAVAHIADLHDRTESTGSKYKHRGTVWVDDNKGEQSHTFDVALNKKPMGIFRFKWRGK